MNAKANCPISVPLNSFRNEAFSFQRYYTHRLILHIAQSTCRVMIAVRGEGQEPRLDFEPNLVEFGPILPHGVGDEVDVIVRNPCPFAIEFYSLDFDKQYLLEEKVRTVIGFAV